MRAAEKALLYWNTVRCLRPVQIAYQLKKRVQPKGGGKMPQSILRLGVPEPQDARILIPELDCGEAYMRRFRPDLLMEDSVTLLHECHQMDGSWEVPGASRLWNYNLHYLEFLIPLAALFRDTGERRYLDKWIEYAESWMSRCGGAALEPYAISMRIPNLLICRELLGSALRGTETERRLLDGIYRQYRLLLKNKELSLLANHYFENLKAIVLCSAIFREWDVYRRHFRQLLGQVGEQLLGDGMHFERSFSYHRIILEDMLRLCVALPSLGRGDDAARLAEPILRMARFLGDAEADLGRVPLFNDAGGNVSKGREELLSAAWRICGRLLGIDGASIERRWARGGSRRTAFPDSGYYRLESGDRVALFDCGEIGPEYMGGHSHCDCLSFELFVGGERVFCNSGTGQYQGSLRSFFRSTMAHNTSMIDEREQSELWGEHRAARRIRDVRATESGGSVAGHYESYQGDSFGRMLRWEGDCLSVEDAAVAHGGGGHLFRIFFHLAPGFRYEEAGCGRVLVRRGDVDVGEVMVPRDCSIAIHRDGKLACCAEDFGRYRRKEVLEVRKEFRGRVRLETRIRIRRD